MIVRTEAVLVQSYELSLSIMQLFLLSKNTEILMKLSIWVRQERQSIRKFSKKKYPSFLKRFSLFVDTMSELMHEFLSSLLSQNSLFETIYCQVENLQVLFSLMDLSDWFHESSHKSLLKKKRLVKTYTDKGNIPNIQGPKSFMIYLSQKSWSLVITRK